MSEVVIATIALTALSTAAYMYYQFRNEKEHIHELRHQIETLRNNLREVKSIVSKLRRGLEERITLILGEIEDIESKVRVLEDKAHVSDKKINEILENAKNELTRMEVSIKAFLNSIDTRIEKLEVAYTGLSSRTRRVDDIEKELGKLKEMVNTLKDSVNELKKNMLIVQQPKSREERDRILVEKWLSTPIEERSVNKIAKEFNIHPSTAMRILRKYLGENYRNATWKDNKHNN